MKSAVNITPAAAAQSVIIPHAAVCIKLHCTADLSGAQYNIDLVLLIYENGIDMISLA